MEIMHIDARLTSQSKYYYLELSVNNKEIEISFWQSHNIYMDCWWDNGWEILNDVDLTDEERNAVEDYIMNLDLSQIK